MKFLSFFLLLLIFQSCKVNYSVSMKNIPPHYTPKTYGEYLNTDVENFGVYVNGLYLDLNWEHAIPLYFVNYQNETTMRLNVYAKEPHMFLTIKDITIHCTEINLDKTFLIDKKYIVDEKIKEEKYGETIRISIKKFLTEEIQKEEDIQIFKNVKKVEVIIRVQVNGKPEVNIPFSFTPVLRKSNAVLDGMMGA